MDESSPYKAGLTGTSLIDVNLAAGATYSYEVKAFDASGHILWSQKVTVTVPFLDLSGGFSGGSGLVALNGSARVNGAQLQLTDGGAGEAGSAFTSGRLDVSHFSTQFSFQVSNPVADGFTFAIQGASAAALGPAGGGLGYGTDHVGGAGGIGKSVAVKFDLYDNAGEGFDSTGLYTNGAAPTSIGSSDLSGAGIDLHSGHVFNVSMNYDDTVLQVAIVDASTGAQATHVYSLDIPAIVGGTTAFVGFTGGTGGDAAIEDILSWTYGPPPALPT